MFEDVANKYDIMNDIMSFGIHRLWKDQFMLELNPSPGTHLLDVAGGTGTQVSSLFSGLSRRYGPYLKVIFKS